MSYHLVYTRYGLCSWKNRLFISSWKKVCDTFYRGQPQNIRMGSFSGFVDASLSILLSFCSLFVTFSLSMKILVD